MTKKTHDEFIAEVKELVGDEYAILGQYENSKTKVKIRHNNDSCDNHEWDSTPNQILRGRKCPICAVEISARNRCRTQEQFENEIFDLVGDEYTVLGDYKNSATKLPIKHNVCEHIWMSIPSDFLNTGRRCPKCSGRMKKNTDVFKAEVYEVVGDEYSVMDEYINTHTKITMRHDSENCNYHQWRIEPNSFLGNGRRCPICSKRTASVKIRKTHEKFLEEVYQLVGNEYTVMDTYKGNKCKVTIRHNNSSCNYNSWKVTPNGFLRGIRCPKCYHSKGEDRIASWLNKKDIDYVTQYRFNDCKDKKPLPFDFALFANDLKLWLLIEYDGELHYEKSGYRNADSKFKTMKRHDDIKTQYCKSNNIRLIRIPYWEFDNIEYILDEVINTKEMEIKNEKQ